MGHVIHQLWDLAHPEASMLMALNHVAIVQTAIKEAKKPGGFRDRDALLKANGVFVTPQNQSVHFHRHISGKVVDAETPHALRDFETDLGADDDLPRLPPPDATSRDR